MHVLILTCNTGEGHNSSAAAIQESLLAAGHTCDIVDVLCFLSEKTSEFISGWHARIYRHLPKMFNSGYSYVEHHPVIFEDNRWLNRYLSPAVSRLYAFLGAGRCDHILCVHVFAALMVTELRQQYGLQWDASFLATDYTCSPIVNETAMDTYFIPHEDLIPEFAENGIPTEKLAPVGIPVRHAFFDRVDRCTAKERLGIPAYQRTILLMGGSMGCGPIEELAMTLLEQLPDDTVLMAACGRNEKLLNLLQKKKIANLHPFGYTSQIPLLMSGVELFLTKPGGISITEAGAKHLPMLLIDTVGGNEARNLDFFTRRGWASAADTPAAMAARCVELLNNPVALENQSCALGRAFCRNPAELICSYITSPAQEDVCP